MPISVWFEDNEAKCKRNPHQQHDDEAELKLVARGPVACCTRHPLPSEAANRSIIICAIGGITPGRAGDLIRAGADLIAAVEGVFAADDVKAAAQAYASQF